MGQAVGVHLGVGDRSRARPGLGDDDIGFLEEGSGPGAVGELGGELPEAEVLGLPLSEAESSRVPERRRPPVAEHDLVAVRKPEKLGKPGTDAADDIAHAALTVARPEIGRRLGLENADALGPDLRRPRAETAVFGQQVLWNDECGQGEPPKLTGDDRFARRQLKFHAVGRGALTKGRRNLCQHRQMATSPSPDRPSELPRISRRIANVAPSATLAIDAKAKQLKAQGVDVVGFGAGEPDFPTPPAIVEAAVAACRDPRNHRYTPTAGLPELREAIVAKTARDSGYEITPKQVLVTNGGKHAVYNAFATLLDPGDEVLLPTPYWTTYPEPIRLAGAVPIEVPTGSASGFKVTVEQLEAAATDRTKMIVFVSPSNPTGAVYSRDQIAEIGQLAVERGWWVFTDEIYEHLVYEGHSQHSIPVVVPELADRCVVANGVAKTYAMTGWRVGWLIGPADVLEAATNLQSHQTSNVNNVAQRAAIAALTGDLSAVEEMRDAFDRRRRTIFKMLSDIKGVTCLEPEGAFYAFPSFEGVLGRELRGKRPATTLELADLVLEESKVAFVPGEAFGAPGYGRFSYALSDTDLVRGIERIGELFAELGD